MTEKLSELAAWMRENGVRRLRTGETEIEFGASPPPLPPRAPPTPEDEARAKHEARRRRYERELGRRVTDEELKRLP